MDAIVLEVLAVAPPLFLLYLIYKKDKLEREPLGLVIKTLLFGMISVIPILIVEILFSSIFFSVINENSIIGAFVKAFFIAALVEEFFKFLFCMLAVWNNKEFNYTFDAIVYAAASSAGFALLENVKYVFNSGIRTGIMRAFLSIPGHIIFGIFMGVFLGKAKYYYARKNTGKFIMYMALSLIVPMFIHGTYDFLLMSNLAIGAIICVVGMFILDIFTIIFVHRQQKADCQIEYVPTPVNVQNQPFTQANVQNQPQNPVYNQNPGWQNQGNPGNGSSSMDSFDDFKF